MRVVIDPGHNYSGSDTGATGYGLREQDIAFYIADKVREKLINAGVTVKMTRNSIRDNLGYGTVKSSLSTRANIANSWGADLFVSIHCNAGGGHGSETYCYAAGVTRGYAAARAVQKRLCQIVGLTNRGVKVNSGLAVLRQTNMPAILVETAFIDHAGDAAVLGSQEGRERFAEAICAGICDYGWIAYGNGEGVLSVTQYEELKQDIRDLTETVKQLGEEVAAVTHPMIYNYIDSNMPEWARPSIQKAVNKGYLKGDGQGLNLDDNLLRTFVLLDRAGALGE